MKPSRLPVILGHQVVGTVLESDSLLSDNVEQEAVPLQSGDRVGAAANIKPEFQEYELKDANQALIEMKQGKIRGAKVLVI